MAILLTDQIDIAVDAVTGDIPATGDLPMSSGLAAVMQGARIRLRLVMGEWFANLEAGVPTLERVGVPADKALLGQKFDRLKAIRAYRDALLGTATTTGVPGIVELTTLEASFDGPTRKLTVTWSARTEFGDTPLDVIKVGA